MASGGAGAALCESLPDDVPKLGITLTRLLKVVAELEDLARAEAAGNQVDCDPETSPLAGLTTSQVNSSFIVRVTHGTQSSYCSQHEGEPGIAPATVFVSHAWSMPFVTLVSSLRAWAAAQPTHPAQPEPVFWLDLVSNNQHKTSDRPFTWWTTCFRDNIGRLGRVLLVLEWRTPRPLTRAWCLWEIACAASTGAHLELLLSPEEEAGFAAALAEDMPRMLGVLTDIDVGAAQAFLPRDRDMILLAAEETVGLERLNVQIATLMRRWMLRAGMAQLARLPAEERAASGLQHALADLHCELGERGEALAMFQAAVEARSGKYGPRSPQALLSATMVAWMLGVYHGRLEEALVMSAEALEGTAAALGPVHPDALVALNQHAILLKRAGRLDEAEDASARALAGRVSVFGEVGVPSLKSMTSHANLLAARGRHAEALALFRRGLQGKRASLGGPHPSTLSSVCLLAGALVAAADAGAEGVDPAAARDEAARLLCDGLPLMRRVLGRDHPDTLAAEKRLAAIQAVADAAAADAQLDAALPPAAPAAV